MGSFSFLFNKISVIARKETGIKIFFRQKKKFQ